MSDIERALGFVDTITGATSLGTSIASEILQKHNSKYSRVDDFLASRIIENGIVTEDDYNTAARLLLIPQMRKKCKGIANQTVEVLQVFHGSLNKTILGHIQMGIDFHSGSDTGVADGF